MYEQKDIVLIPFPFSDLSGNKQRPALIVSNNKLNKSDDRICCLVTSNDSSNSLKINKTDQKNGELPFQSYVKPHRLFTIDKNIVKKKLCSVSDSFYNEIESDIQDLIVQN